MRVKTFLKIGFFDKTLLGVVYNGTADTVEKRDLKKIKTKKVNLYRTGFFLLPQHLDFGHVSYLTVTRALRELKQSNQVVNCTLKTPRCPRTQIWNQNSKKKIFFPLRIFAFLYTPEPFQITDISRKHKKKLRE